MNKQLIQAALATLVGIAGVVPVAQASDGTITFNGAVTATTCNINGAASPSNFTVTLPTVSTSALGAAGQTAGDTGFSIALTDCTADGQSVTTNFEAGPAVDLASGRLNNTASGGPAMVQIQLLNAQGGVITVAGATQNAGTPVPIVSGAATMNYVARYYATAAAAAGAVASSVTYSIAYQ